MSKNFLSSDTHCAELCTENPAQCLFSGFAIARGPNYHTSIRLLHSDSKAQDLEDSIKHSLYDVCVYAVFEGPLIFF